MFPIDFAFDIIERFSKPGDRVLDPFAGRASSIYAAATTGRSGVGIEINPVGWLYGRVKLCPAPEDRVVARLNELGRLAGTVPDTQLEVLPRFYRACFTDRVLRFLIAARGSLAWRTSAVDGTLMAHILVYLHGKRNYSLSNQMRQGKSMAPDYSMRWWQEHGSHPPDIDPVDFLAPRIRWRYAKGRPPVSPSRILLGDCTRTLSALKGQLSRGREKPFDLLFTSPPYYSITNYHYDQWLRLWLLGGQELPTKRPGPWQKKFEGLVAYRQLLGTAFRRCAPLMAPSATVYVRTDARPVTLAATCATVKAAFGEKRIEIIPRPLARKSQTALFGDSASKPGEVDLVLQPVK